MLLHMEGGLHVCWGAVPPVKSSWKCVAWFMKTRVNSFPASELNGQTLCKMQPWGLRMCPFPSLFSLCVLLHLAFCSRNTSAIWVVWSASTLSGWLYLPLCCGGEICPVLFVHNLYLFWLDVYIDTCVKGAQKHAFHNMQLSVLSHSNVPVCGCSCLQLGITCMLTGKRLLLWEGFLGHILHALCIGTSAAAIKKSHNNNIILIASSGPVERAFVSAAEGKADGEQEVPAGGVFLPTLAQLGAVACASKQTGSDSRFQGPELLSERGAELQCGGAPSCHPARIKLARERDRRSQAGSQ